MFKDNDLRKQRDKIILSNEKAICKINDKIYTVKSQTGIGSYKLEWKGYHWVCNCPDFIKNGHIRPCKHVLALKLHLEVGYLKTDEEEPKITPVTYSQNWSNYNLSQRQEFELFDQLLYDLVQSIEETSHHLGRPKLKEGIRFFVVFSRYMASYQVEGLNVYFIRHLKDSRSVMSLTIMLYQKHY